MRALKEKIEYWWYFGDQHKTEKIVYLSILIPIAYIVFTVMYNILTSSVLNGE
jgi:hypothetical protein